MLQMGWLHCPMARKETLSSAQMVQVILDCLHGRETTGSDVDAALFIEGTKIGAVGFKELVGAEVPRGTWFLFLRWLLFTSLADDCWTLVTWPEYSAALTVEESNNCSALLVVGSDWLMLDTRRFTVVVVLSERDLFGL